MSSLEAYRERVYAAYGLTCRFRYATLRDIRNPTLGPKVAKIAARLGTPFRPDQRYVVDTALEIDRHTGIFRHRSVGYTVVRQSGKTSVLLPVAIHRCLAWQRQIVRYAAQNGTAAREKWEDEHLPLLETVGWIPAEGEPLRPHHKARARRSNGREALIWRQSRSIYGLQANTAESGHGKTMHLGLNDEFFAQVDDRIYASWSPAMSTVAMAQYWWASTAGTSRSVPLNEARDLGRQIVQSGADSRIAYFELSDDPENDRRDERLWATYMPALCPTPGPCRCSADWRHTVTLETIRHEQEQASTPSKLAEYDRAYRNITREDHEVAPDPLVPTIEAWELLADDRSEGEGAVAVGIDAYQGWAAIVAMGQTAEGLRRQVVLEHGPGDSWVVERALRIKAELKPVAWAIDDKGESAKLIPKLLGAGFKRMSRTEPERGALWVPSTSELGGATANWCDRVNQGQLVHLGQKVMTQALAVTRTRPIGDGAYAVGRKVSTADITPVAAGVLADAALERYADLVDQYTSIYETRGLTVLGGDDDDEEGELDEHRHDDAAAQ